MKNVAYTRAQDLSEAIGQLAVPGRTSKVLSGGMDLLDLLKERLENPDVLVSISRIPGLDAIESFEDGSIAIGPRVTLTELSESAVLNESRQALSYAAGNAATPQIRNRASVGGNLLQRPRCLYFRKRELDCMKTGGEGCPAIEGQNRFLGVLGGGPCHAVQASSTSVALVALDAALEIAGPEGNRTLPIADLYQLPSVDPTRETTLADGEIIAAIVLPPLPTGTVNAYYKVRHKEAYDWAMAEAAASLTLDGSRVTDCRIVIGGVAPIPWRSSEAEALLRGQALTDVRIRAAAEAALSEAEPLSQNAYKVPVAIHVVEGAIREAAGLPALSR